MATFEKKKNRTVSIAMNNHNFFISGQGGTGKHVLLRNKPVKVNAFFTPIGRISEFVILSIHEHLVFYPGPLV